MKRHDRSRRWPGVRMLAGVALAALSCAASAQQQAVLQSGPERVALIELYTSQGCSSCPPADQWLSRLKGHAALWRKVVPVAFHVDYWDYIGWRDPFARPGFGKRQRRYAMEGGTRTVYTPGIFLNGKDWRGWTREALPPTSPVRAGTLSVEDEGQTLRIRFQSADPEPRSLRTEAVLLGFDRTSRVTAGENRGEELENDFIVLEATQSPMRRDGGVFVADIPDFLPRNDFPRFALAVWVADTVAQRPLQAVGGWWEPGTSDE